MPPPIYFYRNLLTFIYEAVHISQLKEIPLVQGVDALLDLRIVDLAGADVSIQYLIGESQFVLVGLAAESVRRNLLDEYFRTPSSRPMARISAVVKLEIGLKSPAASP